MGGDTNIPVPDPSFLTTQALEREINHLVTLFNSQLDMLRVEIVTHKELVTQSFVEKDLRDNQRFDAQSKALDAARIAADLAVQAALVAAEKAVSKAEIAAEKRFDTVSEKVDDARTITSETIASIQSQIASITGRGAGGTAVWGYVIGAVGIIIAVVTFANALFK